MSARLTTGGAGSWRSLKASPPRPTRRRDVASRICAAVFGGYAAASAASMLLARVLPLAKPDATAFAILLSSALYLAAILWAFAARSPSRAWLGLVAATVVCGGLALGLMKLGWRL